MKTVTFLLITAFSAPSFAFQNADLEVSAKNLNSIYHGQPGAIELFMPNVEAPYVAEPSRREPDMILPVETMIADQLMVVAVEVNVPTVSDEQGVLKQRLNVLESKYGFVWDQTPPRRVGRYSIQPFPSTNAKPKASYWVRGLMRASQVNELAREPMVLRVTREKSGADAQTIEAFVAQHKEHVLGLEGVVAIEAGIDCGEKGEHRHIRAHKPAVVVMIDEGFPEEMMARYLMNEVPELRGLPFRFEKTTSQAKNSGERRCFLLEGCGKL